MHKDNKLEISLRVVEAELMDAGHAVVRMDLDDMEKISVSAGDIICISTQREAPAKVLPAYKEHSGKSIIQVDEIIRENIGVEIDDRVVIGKSECSKAESVVIVPIVEEDYISSELIRSEISKLLEGLPVVKGNRVRASFPGSRHIDFRVLEVSPEGVVLLDSTTLFEIVNTNDELIAVNRISYKDIGGLHSEIKRIREMVELPLKYPEIFERIGINPPSGVLLYGPPGTGKTLIARAVATETHAHFIALNGPEIIHKFYGESEENLRKVFEDASNKAPSIIFIDEIDAIAPKRTEVAGEVEKRVVGQLLALMDGLEKRKHVVVIGATNIPDALDQALRRPGRFDREISINVPDKGGRVEILKIHTRSMPLAEDVDLSRLGEVTHGFVGADLEALCREAAMLAIREIIPDINLYKTSVPYEVLIKLKVNMEHFTRALLEVEPSAIREVFVEIPNVRWEDIGGLDEIKDTLKSAIEWPLKYSELFNHVKARPPKGILLAGPPGTGKTLIAKAAASENNANFISIKGPELFSKWVGESEKRVREVFKKAKQAAPCVIFFDEIDALSSQGNDSGVSQRVVCQLLTELDGVEELKGVVVLAATNRINLVDSALLRQGRFDQIFEISQPTNSQRVEIFKIHMRGRPVTEDVDLEELANCTEGLVGSDIHGICEMAAMRAISTYLKIGEECIEHLIINSDDMHWAINRLIVMKKIGK